MLKNSFVKQADGVQHLLPWIIYFKSVNLSKYISCLFGKFEETKFPVLKAGQISRHNILRVAQHLDFHFPRVTRVRNEHVTLLNSW
jgi:hypothetical protein